MFRISIVLMFGLCVIGSKPTFANSSIFFQCKGPGMEYQVIFEYNEAQKNLTQIIQEPDRIQPGKVARETKTTLIDFKISNDFVNYLKDKKRFSISRLDGKVLRDNQDIPIQCIEIKTDYLAAKRAEVKTAKTTTTEFWSPTTGYADTNYVKLGMLATTNEICAVFSHPFFNFSSGQYRALDTMNSDFDWDGIDAASIWIRQQFQEKGVQLRRFWLMKNIHQAANDNLSACLEKKERAYPGFYEKLTRHFLGNLGYRGVKCIEQQFQTEKIVDNRGNIIERRVPVESQSCIDFNYNSGALNGWNTSTLTLMLIWKEAHPVLKTIFDKGERILVARIAETERRLAAKAAKEQERKDAAEETRLKAAKDWSDYQTRQKTLMEQVYNFATTGYPEGLKTLRWVEEQPCILTDGNRRFDNRLLNMTAFRIYREYIGSVWYTISTDVNARFVTSGNIPVDRLKNAWRLAFQKCPGKKSVF